MKSKLKLSVLALVAGSSLVAPALAANDSPWMVRFRVIDVIPDESSQLTGGAAGTVDISTQVVPELDITYFFDKNWAAELILATTPHDIEHSAAGDLGSVWLLPPTLTLQYHLDPDSQDFRPYVGAGVNYTIFYNIDDNPGLNMDYGNSFGFALQAGFDVPVGGGWVLNADIKKVWINTDVELNGVDVGDVDINPWVLGVGVGYRF